MNYKEIITIVVLLAVVYMLFQLMKTNKVQTDILVAIAGKTGAVPYTNIEGKKSVKSKKSNDDDDGNEETESGKVGAPKSKPKKIHKQFLSLFKDEIPKTTSQIKELFKKNFYELNATKFNNTIQYMVKMGLLGKEKGSKGGQNYWGPADWFDKEGLMYEDYLEKVTAQKS